MQSKEIRLVGTVSINQFGKVRVHCGYFTFPEAISSDINELELRTVYIGLQHSNAKQQELLVVGEWCTPKA